MSQQPVPQETFYDRVGGHETFVRLVREFYRGVAGDEKLRALYPEEDLGPAEVRLRMFLEQYWGGPDTYNAERGHPRLRMRHHPFVVDMAARDRWLELMALSLADVSDDELPKPHRDAMWEHMVRVADMLINKPA